MTAQEAGQPVCEACGHASSPKTRFCTRCGARLPAVDSAAPRAAAAAAAPGQEDTPALSDPAAPRWKLDTPSAAESWWRNPLVVALALVTALAGSGVASWQFFIRSSSGVSALHALTRAEAPVPGTATAAAPPAAPAVGEAAFVGAIDDILRQSHAGIHAARGQHDYGAALRNRRRLVAALDRVDASGQAAPLAAAYATLRDALATSASADAAHLACNCDDTLPDDVAATRLKRRFAEQFDPYAERYAGHAVDPDRI